MDTIQLIMDSVATVRPIANAYLINPAASEKSVDWFDIVYKIAIGIIAGCNLLFSIYIHKSHKKKEIETNKQNLLNVLILKHKLDKFYEIFKGIHSECKVLLDKNIEENEKENLVNTKLEDLFIRLNIEFVTTLRAADISLSQEVLDIADKLQGKLSENIFDQGVNLHVKAKYDELIQNPISDAETQIIQKLYEFR